MAAENFPRVLADYHQLIRRLRALLSRQGTRHFQSLPRPAQHRQATLREAATELALNKDTVQRLAKRHRIAHRGNRLTDEQRETADRLIQNAQHSLEQIRRFIGASKSAVVRRRQQLLDAEAEVAFTPRRLQQPRVCERGHETCFAPCVICQAEQQTAQQQHEG